jgi:hypothetical protein
MMPMTKMAVATIEMMIRYCYACSYLELLTDHDDKDNYVTRKEFKEFQTYINLTMEQGFEKMASAIAQTKAPANEMVSSRLRPLTKKAKVTDNPLCRSSHEKEWAVRRLLFLCINHHANHMPSEPSGPISYTSLG